MVTARRSVFVPISPMGAPVRSRMRVTGLGRQSSSSLRPAAWDRRRSSRRSPTSTGDPGEETQHRHRGPDAGDAQPGRAPGARRRVSRSTAPCRTSCLPRPFPPPHADHDRRARVQRPSCQSIPRRGRFKKTSTPARVYLSGQRSFRRPGRTPHKSGPAGPGRRPRQVAVAPQRAPAQRGRARDDHGGRHRQIQALREAVHRDAERTSAAAIASAVRPSCSLPTITAAGRAKSSSSRVAVAPGTAA